MSIVGYSLLMFTMLSMSTFSQYFEYDIQLLKLEKNAQQAIQLKIPLMCYLYFLTEITILWCDKDSILTHTYTHKLLRKMKVAILYAITANFT